MLRVYIKTRRGGKVLVGWGKTLWSCWSGQGFPPFPPRVRKVLGQTQAIGDGEGCRPPTPVFTCYVSRKRIGTLTYLAHAPRGALPRQHGRREHWRGRGATHPYPRPIRACVYIRASIHMRVTIPRASVILSNACDQMRSTWSIAANAYQCCSNCTNANKC